MVRTTKSGKRRSRLKPMRQGALDALCGIYSIVNAVRLIAFELNAASAGELFDRLFQSLLGAVGSESSAVTGGIGRPMLAKLVREAAIYMLEEFDVRLKVQRLPKALRQGGSRDQLWQMLKERVGPSCVAIVGLEGKHSHWTVVAEVSSRQCLLFDSGNLRALRKAECAVKPLVNRHQILPKHVILIERLY